MKEGDHTVQYLFATSPTVENDSNAQGGEITLQTVKFNKKRMKSPKTPFALLISSISEDAPPIFGTSFTISFPNTGHGYSRADMSDFRLLDGQIVGLNGEDILKSSLRLDLSHDLKARVYYDAAAQKGVLHCSRALAAQIEAQIEAQNKAKESTKPRGQIHHPRKRKR